MSALSVNLGQENPVFDGLFDYCRLYTTGSIGNLNDPILRMLTFHPTAGAQKLVENQAEIVLNWSGGMHHAKRNQASGFCYINDCVLAILELLKYVPSLLLSLCLHLKRQVPHAGSVHRP